MSEIQFNYCLPTDNLYIAFSEERSMVGDEEFQSCAVLYRNKENDDIIGIEIINFKEYEDNIIKISENEALDMTVPFKFLRALIQFHDLKEIAPKLFEKAMNQYLKESICEDTFNMPIEEPYLKKIPIENSSLSPIM